MEFLFYLLIFLILVAVGYLMGKRAERRHFASILAREERLRHVQIVQSKTPPPVGACDTFFVCGAVVIGQDYFKMICARIKKLFGGNLTSYESLLERGRREAVLRLKEQAAQQGAQYVCNVKFGSADIIGQSADRSGDGVEVYAYGTAIAPRAQNRLT